MKAMILAAGLGTRLRPLTEVWPKPLFPLMLQPMLARVLDQLTSCGVDEVVINVHHQAEPMRRWCGEAEKWRGRLHLSYESELLETAGGIKRVEALLGDAPFLVVNADVVMALDLRAVWQWHCQHGALVTMVVRPDPAAHAYGPVIVGRDRQVLQINGRPPCPAPVAGEKMVFTGAQVVSPEVLAYIPPDRKVSTTAETYPTLVAQGQAVYAYPYTGYWMDIGVPDRYLQAHWDMLDRVAGAPEITCLPAGSQLLRSPQALPAGPAGVTIRPPVLLGPDVQLAPGACVGPYAVLGAGCQVAVRATVAESVLWEGARVAEGAQVRRCILGKEVQVPASSVWHNTIQAVLPG